MKLKKRQFARLKDIAEEVNTSGMFGLGGVKLDKLIADIESVQKPKIETVQEEPLRWSDLDVNSSWNEFYSKLQEKVRELGKGPINVKEKPLTLEDLAKEAIFYSQRKSVEDSIRKERESMVAASTDNSTEFKGGLRDAVKALAEPKIGDVGYFWSETSEGYIQYGVLKEILNDGYKSKLDLCYDYFSKTPPDLK